MASSDMDTSTKEDDSISSGSITGRNFIHEKHARSHNMNQSLASDLGKRPEAPDEVGIARAEDRAVFRIRLMVSVFLTLCTIGVACLVYISAKRQETDAFKTDAYDFSTKIFAALGSGLDQSLGAIDSFVVSTVSFAATTNQTWPFVVIPNVGTKLSKVRSATKATILAIVPRVTEEQREEWNSFSFREGDAWVQDNLRLQQNDPGFKGVHLESYILSPVYDAFGNYGGGKEVYYPNWQAYPTAMQIMPPFNFDVSSITPVEQILRSKIARLSDISNNPEFAAMYNFWLPDLISPELDATEPVSELHYPIFDDATEEVLLSNSDEGEMVGLLFVTFYWRDFLIDILPTGIDGLVVVVENACNNSFTYQINGPNVEYQGFGDHHDSHYDYLRLSSSLEGLKNYSTGARLYTGLPLSDDQCSYTVNVYPSEIFEDRYLSSNPWIYTIVSISIFIFTSGVFWVYDLVVERRQKKVMFTALKSSAIVSSLFPSNVRDRLYDQDGKGSTLSQKNRLKTFMNNGHASDSGNGGVEVGNRPIADLFPETTVMFGDISGFTAWSSTREPSQVFILLESLYGTFDDLAAKRGVFKVETIGDCYVAVAGLPDPRPNHAVVMARFARDCYIQMHVLTSKLAITLGPDTEELSMRFGLNSGPVTAGVLRGQKSRFQLFGDTVNTAARMESSGQRKRIHASQSTADELRKHKKGDWVHAREDMIEVKGKGLMTTYWIEPPASRSLSTCSKEESALAKVFDFPSATNDASRQLGKLSSVKIDRLVDWNAEVLGRLLRAIVARRTATKALGTQSYSTNLVTGSPIDEVKEIIVMPPFDPNHVGDNPDSIELDPKVQTQIRDYVATIAATYSRSNPFHNFEHASHVCMSVAKLMSRIVATDNFFEQNQQNSSMEAFKHEQTFGIASDPLTLFACTFAALVHDADHPGVPNTQVVKEGTDLAKKYNNRSVAEQRSVDIAWNLLMEDKFKDLRLVICPTRSELQRFRELVVNSVMATDIMDKDLKQLRNDRWDRAFDVSTSASDDKCTAVNRKATIVIEHLIQASDVAHTMQHWHVFRKWNECLFTEMYQAYKGGRAERNPAEFWYEGELGFFDFYIIPLAKKLSSCGVFGVSSDEYLNYAIKNREEWEQKGKQIVSDMLNALN